MKIISASILHQEYGQDVVWLETNLESPFPPEVSSAALSLEFKTRKNYAEDYLAKTFPDVPVTVINNLFGKESK